MCNPEELSVIKYPGPFLHILAEQLRTGVLAAEGHPIQKKIMKK